MEELYQKGMELWETAEQLIKQHKIDSSEGRREMVSYQKQAVECWQTAAEQGDAKAQHQLGCYFYNYGKNSNKNKKAFEWYSKAAEGGMASAAHILGDRYCGGKSRNYKKAIYWYTKALELGMQGAVEHQIGWCYEKLGDFEHAIEWYMKGAEKGIGDIVYHLAELYETGTGVPKDFTKAIEWYRVSAKLGYPDADLWLKEKGF